MTTALKSAIVGALALAGAGLATVEAQAMPVQPLAPAAAADVSIDQVYWRYGYGYRRPFFRYGYGFRRPFLAYRPFAYRRFGYPLYRGYRYGYRRW